MANRSKRRDRRRGGLCQHKNSRINIPLFPPLDMSLGFRKKLIQLGLPNARLATTVNLRSYTANDIFDHRANGRIVPRRIRSDNPITIELRLRENLNRVRGI